jgi:hypothetical protein
MPVVIVFVLGMLLVQAAPAGAVAQLGVVSARPALRLSTQIVMSSPITGSGQAVNGFSATAASAFDPIVNGYPATNPSTGGTPALWNVHNIGFAGTLRAHPVDSPATTLLLYCIDIHTVTRAGLGYNLGSWEASGMPNVGYVARLLTDYYPNTNQPSGAGIGNDNQRAAAVQAAIWFFTDRFVVSTSGTGSSLRSAVVDIVNTVIRQGPLLTPPPPSLTITPTSLSGHVNVLGPFTVSTNHLPVTVSATGGTMYSNSAGTTLLGNGTTATLHSSPHQIWLRVSAGNTSDIVILYATSTAVVPSGNVYLYDGNTPGVADAQRVILAAPATLTATVRATGEFKPFGSLVVKKTITGPAAAERGEVRIQVKCNDGVTRPDFVIPPGSTVREHTYHNIPAGTECTVTEISNGTSTTFTHVVTGNGQEVTIPAGGSKTVELKDTYRFLPGKLIVRKIIGGEAAGQQGQIVIRTECDGRHLTPDFVIPAGAGEGLHTNPTTYNIEPTPATCTVTQTVDGHTATVSPPVTVGSGQTVHIGHGESKVAVITDDYGLRPGELEVTKFITGAEAGRQGEIVIQAVCDGIHQLPDFVIPASTTGPVVTHIFPNIPTPATCVVTETSDGSSNTISVDVTGSPTNVKIPPGGAGAAEITDTYGGTPGSLLVTKTIAGPSAGHQGPVIIQVVCDGVALPDFVIPAHTPAGSVTHSFDDISAGSACTITETADGGSSTVLVEVLGNNRTVSIPAGMVTWVGLTDVYDDGSDIKEVPDKPGSPAVDATGSVTVIKHITGPAARHHGRIAILVSCGGPLEVFSLDIPAGTGPGSVTRHFNHIPSGLRCQVVETANGQTSTVAVAASGSRTVTVPAFGSATVSLTDSFTIRTAAAPAPTVTG